MGIFSFLSNAASAATAGLKLALARFTAKNTPAMQANAQAAQDQAQKDQITQDVTTGDAAKIARDIST